MFAMKSNVLWHDAMQSGRSTEPGSHSEDCSLAAVAIKVQLSASACLVSSVGVATRDPLDGF
jgi:hypothetical protein